MPITCRQRNPGKPDQLIDMVRDRLAAIMCAEALALALSPVADW